MSYLQSGVSVWATVAVSMMPGIPDAPSSATLTQTKYQLFSTYGPEASALQLSPQDQPGEFGPEGAGRLRVEIAASGAQTSPFGIALYCQKNGAGYSQVLNTTGLHGFRLFGGGVVTDLQPSLTPTTQRFTPSGNFDPGAILRDESSVFTVPSMLAGHKTEIEYVFVSSLVKGETGECQVRKDDGSLLDAYTVTATILGVGPRAAVGN
jgi:hypothetical protein